MEVEFRALLGGGALVLWHASCYRLDTAQTPTVIKERCPRDILKHAREPCSKTSLPSWHAQAPEATDRHSFMTTFITVRLPAGICVRPASVTKYVTRPLDTAFCSHRGGIKGTMKDQGSRIKDRGSRINHQGNPDLQSKSRDAAKQVKKSGENIEPARFPPSRHRSGN